MVTIMVHPFSFKILQKSGFPYYVSSSDPIYDYFFSTRVIKEIETATIAVTFYFKNNLVKDYSSGIGTSIFKYHKRLIFLWMQAQRSAGRSAYKAMEDFYETYDITDDDYDRDNMYREWLRYSRERNNPEMISVPVQKKYTKSDIDTLMEKIVHFHIEDFITQKEGNFNSFLYKQVYYFLLREYARFSIHDLTKMTGSPRVTVWYHLRNAKRMLEVRQDIALSCLNSLE